MIAYTNVFFIGYAQIYRFIKNYRIMTTFELLALKIFLPVSAPINL